MQISIPQTALVSHPRPHAIWVVAWKVWLLGLLLVFAVFKIALDLWNLINARKNSKPAQEQLARLVIIGGGYAGTYAASTLEREFDVTLVDTKDYFEFTPSRLRALVEPWHKIHIQVGHSRILKRTRLVLGKVESVTTDTVHTDTQVLPYDYLIICTGSRYSEPVFPTPQQIKEQLQQQQQQPSSPRNKPSVLPPFTQHTTITTPTTSGTGVNPLSPVQPRTLILSARAPHFESYFSLVQASQKILVVGGGTVGVELAAEIIETFPHKTVTLVNSPQHLIHRSPQPAIEYTHNYFLRHGVTLLLGERIASHEGTRFYTQSGTIVEADVAFLCTGNVPNSDFLLTSPFAGSVTPRGLVKVNDYLQLEGRPNIFVAGDVCDSYVEEKLCQSAAAEVKLIIDNLRRMVQGRPLEKYSPGQFPMIISLGRYDGVLLWPNLLFINMLTVRGFIPAMLKEFVEWKEMVFYWNWSRFTLSALYGTAPHEDDNPTLPHSHADLHVRSPPRSLLRTIIPTRKHDVVHGRTLLEV